MKAALSLFSFLTAFVVLSVARAEFAVPALTSPVIDEPGLLTRTDRKEIGDLLRQFNDHGKAQMQVLIVQSLDGTPIESATLKAVETWKLGSKSRDNGVLFLISVDDRKMRLEVGYGLEGAIPDAEAKRILAEQVAPLFRTKRYSAGVVQGVYEVLRRADAEFADAHPAPEGGGMGDNSVIVMVVAFLFILLFIGRFASTGSRYHRGTYGGFGGGTFGGGGGWGGGSSSGSGGGGWSGGGGGFGGGGASSGW